MYILWLKGGFHLKEKHDEDVKRQLDKIKTLIYNNNIINNNNMSRSLFITCENCRERLWIGQGCSCFYSGEQKTMDALGKFLFNHRTIPGEEHSLRFMDENTNDDWYKNVGWIDIDIDTYLLDENKEAFKKQNDGDYYLELLEKSKDSCG